jgi:hypothetical protein
MTSNKTIAFLAIGICLVFFVSTFLVSRVAPIQSPTAYATYNASGSVIIQIIPSLSITLGDDLINFGSCEINQTQGYTLLDSFLNATQANNTHCVAGTYPDSILVLNDGTVDANISVSFTQSGESYYNDTDSWVAYKTVSPVIFGGCASPQSTYENITLINTSYSACDVLTFGLAQNRLELYLRTRINASVTSTNELLINFQASIPS